MTQSTQGSTNFIQNFDVPDLWDLMNAYVYRSGGAMYEQLLQDQMEEFKANSAQFELDFTEALESIEAEIQGGATSVQRTIVVPIDIETNVDVQIDYVLDVTHKVNINVNQTLTATYEQEVEVTTNEIEWQDDPIANFDKWAHVARGEETRMAVHDTGAIDSYFSEFGEKPTVDQLTDYIGEAPAVSVNSTDEGGRFTFKFADVDVENVREGNTYGGLTATPFGGDGVLDGYQHRMLPQVVAEKMEDVYVTDPIIAAAAPDPVV